MTPAAGNATPVPSEFTGLMKTCSVLGGLIFHENDCLQQYEDLVSMIRLPSANNYISRSSMWLILLMLYVSCFVVRPHSVEGETMYVLHPEGRECRKAPSSITNH